jgi:hypothetical protein
LKPTNEEITVPSPLGDKIRALRKQKKLSLEQLAELTDSSKSYIWELENKDDRNHRPTRSARSPPSSRSHRVPVDRVGHHAGREVLDEAFFRKYKTMSEPDKKKIRKIIDAWEDE